MTAMAEKIPGWLERILLPQISDLKGDVKALDAKMEGGFKRLDQKIDGVDQRLNQKIDGLDAKLTQRIDGVEQRLGQRIDGVNQRVDALDKKLDVVQRLAVVEAKVQELQAKR
jgi:hypothetical protein